MNRLIRVKAKLFKIRVIQFFSKNRKIQWSRRGIGLTLATVMLSGIILGESLTRWLGPDLFTYSFRVTRTEEAIASTGDSIRTKEQSVKSSTAESPLPSEAKTIEEKIKETFGNEGDIAVAIAKCESSLDPSRVGDTHMKYPSIGLFQVNQTWHKYSDETLKNPDENIRIAKEIRDRWGNYNAWTCFKTGNYKLYLYS